jgi:hypothetical protein
MGGEAVNMTSDDVLTELDGLKKVAVLDPACVRGALACCAGLMMFVECILDEFDKSELPFTRTAILAALLDAAAQMKQPFADHETVGDLATVGDMLHRRRLRRLAH